MATPEVLSPEDDEVVSESTSLSKLEEADRSHQITTARKFPRSIDSFTQKLTKIACHSQETAMEMIYSLPRANQQIVGPSIRFAEAALVCWGNARAGVEIVDVDRANAVVVAEGRFYDCEANVGIAIRRRRRIVAKTVNADSIQITGDAASSIAYRSAILRGIPQALWKPIWNRAKQTAAGDVKSVGAIRDALIKMFTALGVTETMLYNTLEVKGPSDIGADQILAMQSWNKQLQEKSCTLEDIFGSPEDQAIDLLMADLLWNQTKQRLAREQYRGRRTELLAYLKSEMAKQERVAPKKEAVKKDEPKAEKQEPKPEPQQDAEPTAEPEAEKAVEW